MLTAPAPVTVRPRLLSGPHHAESLRDHVARLGPRPAGGRWLIDLLEASGLRGRGGAAFPTGRKWRSVAAERTEPTVVVNVAEGEPASFKDRTLATLRPHLLLDGGALAAETVGSARVILYVGRAHTSARDVLRRAVRERRPVDGSDLRFEIVEAPDRYVSGETAALVHYLNGGAAIPTMTPPRPHQVGIGGRPTLIQNAETIAHVALLARFGADWFREAGTPESPGTALLTVLGAVGQPGVIEVDRAATLGAVIEAAGGLTVPTQALLLGGYFGTWVLPEWAWPIRLDDRELSAIGASLGCGVVTALPAAACGLAESARILRYLAGESAGQCGPCVFGLDAIAATMEEVARAQTDQAAAGRLEHWAKQVAHRGACHHPDGATHLLRSALTVFARDLSLHLHRQRCRGALSPTILPPMPAAEGFR